MEGTILTEVMRRPQLRRQCSSSGTIMWREEVVEDTEGMIAAMAGMTIEMAVMAAMIIEGTGTVGATVVGMEMVDDRNLLVKVASERRMRMKRAAQ